MTTPFSLKAGRRLALASAFLLTTYSAHARPRVLGDQELDKVHGGVATQSAARARSGSNENSPTVTPVQTPSILMSGQAQQNLTALVNVAAVNSSVQVLMNLNVSVNSRVSAVSQGNAGSLTHGR